DRRKIGILLMCPVWLRRDSRSCAAGQGSVCSFCRFAFANRCRASFGTHVPTPPVYAACCTAFLKSHVLKTGIKALHGSPCHANHEICSNKKARSVFKGHIVSSH